MIASRPHRLRSAVMALSMLVGAWGCDNSGTEPVTLRFGQVGAMKVIVTTPLSIGAGALVQTIDWSSSGPWSVTERISYRERLGDQNVFDPRVDLDTYASAYATAIAQFNEAEGLSLFVEELDPFLIPDCGIAKSQVEVRIRDDTRGEERTWIRCGVGSYDDLGTAGAGPDAAAGRVVQAAVLVREFTVADDFPAVYRGSIPFATVDRGESSNAALPRSLVFLNDVDWPRFWAEHRDPDSPAPFIDFERDLVIVGAQGPSLEAGDSIEVRRILQLEGGSVTQLTRRAPGNFCSPAALTHTSFHIVVAPRTALPMSFPDAALELVDCG